MKTVLSDNLLFKKKNFLVQEESESGQKSGFISEMLQVVYTVLA